MKNLITLYALLVVFSATCAHASPVTIGYFNAIDTGSNTFSINLMVKDLSYDPDTYTLNQIVAGFDINVLYDSSLTLTGVNFGNWLGTSPDVLQEWYVVRSGVANIASVSLLNSYLDPGLGELVYGDTALQYYQKGAAGDLVLATLLFSGPIEVANTLGFGWWSPENAVIGTCALAFVGGYAVPEPRTYMLMGSGLLFLVGLRSRKKLDFLSNR